MDLSIGEYNSKPVYYHDHLQIFEYAKNDSKRDVNPKNARKKLDFFRPEKNTEKRPVTASENHLIPNGSNLGGTSHHHGHYSKAVHHFFSSFHYFHRFVLCCVRFWLEIDGNDLNGNKLHVRKVLHIASPLGWLFSGWELRGEGRCRPNPRHRKRSWLIRPPGDRRGRFSGTG